jgi:hypothetical protein
MPTPSDDALEAIDAIKQRNNGNVILRDYEAVALDEYIQSMHAELANRDTALNEARLEGAKLGLEAAAHQFEQITDPAGPLMARLVRTLDPKQVINERVK